MAARARRPRKTDCDPSTDFNLCACEREYSIEAARHPACVTRCARACGRRQGQAAFGRRCATLDPVLVASGVWQLSRCCASRQVQDLSLTERPLHTRPSAGGVHRSLTPAVKTGHQGEVSTDLAPVRTARSCAERERLRAVSRADCGSARAWAATRWRSGRTSSTTTASPRVRECPALRRDAARQPPAEARVVITTAPGEEGQVDYGGGTDGARPRARASTGARASSC